MNDRFLNNHEGIKNVQFIQKLPIPLVKLIDWEKLNVPYILPEELKAFYSISNGFTLKWQVSFGQKDYNLGNMHVESLEGLIPIETISPFPNFVGFYEHEHISIKSHPKEVKIFQLDSACTWGTVGLVYIDSTIDPQIWFQDLSQEWHYIAPNFTDYFRLLVIHLGIPRWQYAYTPIGLDPTIIQWFRFINPERLNIIMNYWKSKREIDENMV